MQTINTNNAKGRVIIGAGDQRWEGWLPTQQNELDLLNPETFSSFFGEDRADAFLCEHTWEHLTNTAGPTSSPGQTVLNPTGKPDRRT